MTYHNSTSKPDVYQRVTDTIVEAIEGVNFVVDR